MMADDITNEEETSKQFVRPTYSCNNIDKGIDNSNHIDLYNDANEEEDCFISENESNAENSSNSNNAFSEHEPMNDVTKDDGNEEDEENNLDEDSETFDIIWGKKKIQISIDKNDLSTFTILDLKTRLNTLLKIPISRQKFLGISGKEHTRLEDCEFKNKHKKIYLLGTPSEQQLLEINALAHISYIYDDQNIPDDRCSDIYRRPFMQNTIERIAKENAITLLHPPRQNKKLLVLDIDYTLIDTKAAGSIEGMKRPYLDYFMKEVYEQYDIAVWSQTHWKWVEMKCTELGFLTTNQFHICFVLDRSSMFTICRNDDSSITRASRKEKKEHRKKKKRRENTHSGEGSHSDTVKIHEVKALEVIWTQYPQKWNMRNTIHVDDLAKNFALNPRNGIKVKAYKCKDESRDYELLHLAKYLKKISSLQDLSSVDHTNWRHADL